MLRILSQKNNSPVEFFTAFCLAPILNCALIPAGMSQDVALPKRSGPCSWSTMRVLPKVAIAMGKKKNALLIAAISKLKMQFADKSSAFVVDGSSPPTFAIVLPSGDTTDLVLYPLSTKKNNRFAVIGTGGGFYGESSTGAETISLDFSKQDDDVFHITPSRSLAAGEYAFGFAGLNEYFCFSVFLFDNER